MTIFQCAVISFSDKLTAGIIQRKQQVSFSNYSTWPKETYTEFTLHSWRKLFGVGLLFTATLILSACGGGGSTSNKPAASNPITPGTTARNVVPIVVDAGPVAGFSQINVAYVSVTVCIPGTSGAQAACQTIDHIQLDTGSTGLRLLNSAINANLSLPQVSNAAGLAIGECTSFAIGTTWGSVRLADIYLGGEVATSVPIQEIGDQPGGATAVPADCSATGTIQNTQALLGSNGILGVGLFTNDCDLCLSQIVPATYYTCNTTGCTNSMVTADQVVKNPVALFRNPTTLVPQDNNGVVVVLSAISAAGVSAPVTGSLIFGIGTQANNALNGAVVYATTPGGNMSTTFLGIPYTSYIDSGSNALFFDGLTVPACSISTWVYCPTQTPMPLNATNTSAAGSANGNVNFSIVNADQLSGSVVAANIGGPSGNGNFVFGLPFFFGRTVFTAISGANTPGGFGPYFAY